MNENLKEAIELMNRKEVTEGVWSLGDVTSATVWALIEAMKDMQVEIDKLKEHLKYLEGE